MGHQHIVYVTGALSPCCRERRQSLSLQECGHLIRRQIWIRWTTASAWGMLQEKVYRSWIHDVSWKNVERTSAEGVEAAGPCTPSSRQRLRSGTVVWMHVFAWMVDILKINFDTFFEFVRCGGRYNPQLVKRSSEWVSDFLLCFVCFVNTGCPKCDRYKHVQSANIVWNVLLLCLRLSHCMVAT